MNTAVLLLTASFLLSGCLQYRFFKRLERMHEIAAQREEQRQAQQERDKLWEERYGKFDDPTDKKWWE